MCPHVSQVVLHAHKTISEDPRTDDIPGTQMQVRRNALYTGVYKTHSWGE